MLRPVPGTFRPPGKAEGTYQTFCKTVLGASEIPNTKEMPDRAFGTRLRKFSLSLFLDGRQERRHVRGVESWTVLKHGPGQVLRGGRRLPERYCPPNQMLYEIHGQKKETRSFNNLLEPELNRAANICWGICEPRPYQRAKKTRGRPSQTFASQQYREEFSGCYVQLCRSCTAQRRCCSQPSLYPFVFITTAFQQVAVKRLVLLKSGYYDKFPTRK